MALRLRLSLWTPAWHGHSSSSNRNKMMSIWLFDIVPDDGFINWCVTYCYHHLSPQCGNPQLFQSTFGIRIFVHPQVHPRVRQFGKIICKIHENGPRGITQRCTKTSQTPNLQNVTQPMTIHDHPWPSHDANGERFAALSNEAETPNCTTPAKNKLSLHIPKTQGMQGMDSNRKSKIHGETSDIDCDYSHVHSSQLLFLSSIFPIGFFQI